MINSLAANSTMLQIMFLGTRENLTNFIVDGIFVEVKDTVKLLGIYIDNELLFDFKRRRIK